MLDDPSDEIKLIVLERDNWTCQLCGLRTSPELRGTFGPDAPEVDHIIRRRDPRSTNELCNLRCLCRTCNLKDRDASNWGFTKETCSLGGKIGSARYKELYGPPRFPLWACAKGGRIGGKTTGQLKSNLERWKSYKTKEHQSRAAKIARHNQWHLRRGIINPKCEICTQA